MRLSNKVVIVTGGGSGIGRAFCLGLAENGASVVTADIDVNSAKKVASEIKKAGGKTLTINELIKHNPKGKNIRIMG